MLLNAAMAVGGVLYCTCVVLQVHGLLVLHGTVASNSMPQGFVYMHPGKQQASQGAGACVLIAFRNEVGASCPPPASPQKQQDDAAGL